MMNPDSPASILYRLDRIEAEAHELDLKVDGIAVGMARIEERQQTLFRTVDELKTQLEARNAEEQKRRRTDRGAMITATAGIAVALISALALVISTGVIG